MCSRRVSDLRAELEDSRARFELVGADGQLVRAVAPVIA